MTGRAGSPSRPRALASLALGLVIAGGCIAGSEAEPIAYACPSSDDFRWVSQVFERRCGTLDCHGDYGRPFRVYGRLGLRKPDAPDPDYVTNGSQGTTQLEYDENRASACGLEPELTEAVLAGDLPPEELTLVRKPQLLEAHKGGRVLAEGSPGMACIVSWLDGGAVDVASCQAELAIP